MGSNVKINGINMFINKFDVSVELINLDILKREFELDKGKTGFYKLSLSKKDVYGYSTVNDNYNRPPVGPIENGLYCSYCEKFGPSNHAENCEIPQKESLYLTLGGFDEYILKNKTYSGDYLYIKEAFEKKQITSDILNDLLSLPDEIEIVNGSIDIANNKDKMTTIAYYGIYKKRGPSKLATKTTTTQFLNNMIIFHEEDDHKTSVRISKNGLINLINVNTDTVKQGIIISELIRRINSSGAVNKSNLLEITGEEEYKKIPKYSYVHSASGQFSIEKIVKGVSQVNFEELDNFITPYDGAGKIIENPRNTTIQLARDGKTPIITLNGIKIIEWEYSMGRMSRHEVMSKEYIKLIVVPAQGLKLTAIINKFGAVMLNISRCSTKQVNNGMCGKGTSDITVDLFDPLESVLNGLFNKNEELLVMKTLSGGEKKASNYNTVSGYAPSGEICRRTRTRESGDSNYKEGMRPDPYSWAGSCPDPNYQYMKPGGVQDKDGRWYPCCETKTKDSIEMMKNYLKTGFPGDLTEMNKYNIAGNVDKGSGILVPDSNSPGSTAMVKINDRFEKVKIIKKLSKKSNDYMVKTMSGADVKVNGENFEKDSRVFPGLKSFNRESLLSCIYENFKKFKMVIDENGNISRSTITEMNEKFDEVNKDTFSRLLKINNNTYPFTYNTIPLLMEEVFTAIKISGNAHRFYLVLSPGNNFYINDNMYSLDSQISNDFKDTFILDGYLSYNTEQGKTQYEITDILYYNKPIINEQFRERYAIIYNIGSILSTVIDELLIIPEVYNNIIDGAYNILQANQYDKILFISDNKNRLSILYDGNKNYTDNIILEILAKKKETITFGYDGKELPEDIGLDFLAQFTFNKREIPTDLKVGDYYNIKINRDNNGLVVPNRKLSIISKVNTTGNMKDYYETVNILLVIFNPINSDYFNSELDWLYKDNVLEYDGVKLVQSN